MKKLHYGWMVCIGCALLLFCTSGLSINAFTVYQPYILQQNRFTNAQSSAIITVRSLFSFLAMFLTGKYYQKFSFRTGMAISGGLIIAAFVGFGLSASHLSYCLSAAAMGLGYGFGTMIPIAIVLEHWFVSKRNFAIGICSGATGISTLGIPSALTWLIETYSLRTAFLVEAAVVAVLVTAAIFLIQDDPSRMGMRAYGIDQVQITKEMRTNTIVLSRKHWVLIVPMLLLLGAMTSVGYSHLSVLVSSEGFSGHLTALAITTSGILLTLGKFVFGWVSDKLGTYKSNWIFGTILIVGLVLSCSMHGRVLLLFLAMCGYGAGLATTTIGLTAWAGDLSASDQYDSNVRRFQLGYAAGTLVFSSLPGLLADHFGGSYIPAYVFFTFCALFVLLSVQWLYRSTGRAKHRQSVCI